MAGRDVTADFNVGDWVTLTTTTAVIHGELVRMVRRHDDLLSCDVRDFGDGTVFSSWPSSYLTLLDRPVSMEREEVERWLAS